MPEIRISGQTCPFFGMPIPKRSRGIISESPLKSADHEFYQAFFLYFARGNRAEKFFQIVCSLTEQRPYAVSCQSPIKASAESPAELFESAVIQPERDAVISRELPHFSERVADQPAICRINDIAGKHRRVRHDAVPVYPAACRIPI